MDYFKILNLNKEPFSNSPEPGFFFQSTGHLACLQQLELSIRLRRGLNVVMGEVGTGKTTLCRQLILRFAESEEDRNEVVTHLLLDPSFSAPREFLATVAIAFGLAVGVADSEWQLKESIKNNLFCKGVDEKKTVVLIIDEGQKLPEFCLEILREFLNYETNESKLLQIVIFAQNEFGQILKTHANFADRINQYYLLKPLNFREMRAMIRFRLARASRPAGMPEIFTLPGLWAVYRATGGYPRKIITLCHQILLTLIIQNRIRAGWFLARSASRRLMPEPIRTGRWATASLFTGLFLAILTFAAFMPGVLNGTKPAYVLKPTAKQPETRENMTVAAKPGMTTVPLQSGQEGLIRTVNATPPAFPGNLGCLKIRQGGTVFGLLQEIYGSIETGRFQAMIRANPHIRNMDWVRAGETICFPAIQAKTSPLAPGKIWVQIAQKTDLNEAYKLLKDYPADQPDIRLVPSWNSQDGLSFLIVLKGGFPSEREAKDALRKLSADLLSGAGIINNRTKDAIYFAD
jgi:general secretion pathway protein A